MSHAAKSTLAKPLPPWVAPVLVAFVGWTTGAHQSGPLSVYASERPLPFLWHLFEQALAIGITVGALAGSAVLLGGQLPPVSFAYRAACEARYPLALAAALSSRVVSDTMFPTLPVNVAAGKFAAELSPYQWTWLVVMVLAVAASLLQAAFKYLRILTQMVPGTPRAALALLVAVAVGETTGQMLIPRLMNLLFWPP
ncbi:MAG: hypothetical protein N2512_13115 [Armatimonadetes bacterium]|nr:hypothetical protein [Armatimonadota bacterium]